MCKFCDITNKSEELDIFDENEVNTFFERIYAGVITKQVLDINYYHKVARKLTQGIYDGFGNELIKTQWGTPDYDMLFSLRENVYIFSAAKNYQQTRVITSLLTTENGLIPFSEFKKLAIPYFDTYNKNYLTAEYNSAIAQARSASNWLDIERESNIYNQLQYDTVGDARVRPEHAVLNGIVRPVNDKFWDKFYPPNGWNCRCTVMQINDVPNTDLRSKTKPSEKDVPDIFRFNSGKTKQIFSPKHPYFDVAKEDKELAKTNWGLPLPK